MPRNSRSRRYKSDPYDAPPGIGFSLLDSLLLPNGLRLVLVASVCALAGYLAARTFGGQDSYSRELEQKVQELSLRDTQLTDLLTRLTRELERANSAAARVAAADAEKEKMYSQLSDAQSSLKTAQSILRKVCAQFERSERPDECPTSSRAPEDRARE